MPALNGFLKPYPKQADAFRRILGVPCSACGHNNLKPLDRKQPKCLKCGEPIPVKLRQFDICAGRGWGKTMFAIALAVKLLTDYPGITIKFLEPDWKRIREAFLPKWYKMVPQEIYSINRGDNCITLVNGSTLFYGVRNVTGNKQLASDGGRGPDVAAIIDDEAAVQCSKELYTNNLPAIREAGCPNLLYITISTFQYGDYELLIDTPGHDVIYGRTADNTYLPPGLEATMRASMPDDVAAIELDSKRGKPAGRIWSHFTEKAWPEGNILEGYEFDPSKPWYLGCDLGNHGAFQIYQCPPAKHPETGGHVLDGSLLCMVEEWTVNNDVDPDTDVGGFEGILKMIVRKYCKGNPKKNKPKCVFIGHDVNTPGQMKGKAATQVLGALNWPFMYPAGPIAGKDVQRTHATMMMWEKRFVVAATKDKHGKWKTKQHFGEGKARGILRVITQDTYPKGKQGVFDKDKASGDPRSSIEDDRDAMLYTCVLWKHPDEYDAARFYKAI
jgi:hypothetical protein